MTESLKRGKGLLPFNILRGHDGQELVHHTFYRCTHYGQGDPIQGLLRLGQWVGVFYTRCSYHDVWFRQALAHQCAQTAATLLLYAVLLNVSLGAGSTDLRLARG